MAKLREQGTMAKGTMNQELDWENSSISVYT